MRKSGAVDEPTIQSETDRYIAWPAQALSYKLGQLKFRELRERAQKELGPSSTSAASTTRCSMAEPCRSICWRPAPTNGLRNRNQSDGESASQAILRQSSARRMHRASRADLRR